MLTPRRSAAPPTVARRISRTLLPCDPIYSHHTAILWTRLLTDSRPPPSDDIGWKRVTPMNSTPTPKAIEPRDGLIARADEGLAHAYEQIRRADEQLAHVSEQLAKMERDDARPPSAGPGPQSPPRRPALWALVGLPLAACIVVAALVLQSSYGGGVKLVVARLAPQLVSTPSLPPENPPLSPKPAPSTVDVAAAGAAAPQATPFAQTAPQDAAPTATEALPDHAHMMQTMALDLANLELTIELILAITHQLPSD